MARKAPMFFMADYSTKYVFLNIIYADTPMGYLMYIFTNIGVGRF